MILDELYNSASGKRTIKMARFFTFFDQHKEGLGEQLLGSCRELLELNRRIIGVESYLIMNNDSWLEERLAWDYGLFDALWLECTPLFNFEPTLSPNMKLVILLNNTKNDLLNLSGSLIRARKERKLALSKNIFKAEREGDHELAMGLRESLDTLNAVEIDLYNRKVDARDPFWEANNTKSFSEFFNYGAKASLSELNSVGKHDAGTKCFDYYKNVFGEKKLNSNVTIESFLEDIPRDSIPKLNQADRTALEVGFTNVEILNQLKSMKEGKSVGLDGISTTFLKHVIPLNIEIVNRCFNDCYLNGGNLDSSLKSIYIKLIPKNNADHSTFKGWRPISIISNIQKLYCKVIYARLEGVVDNLSQKGQYAYRKSRDISDVRLNLIELVDSLKKSGTGALLLSLDFSSAFDVIEHAFIKEMLTFYGFPENFISAMGGYLSNNVAGIILDDGNMTEFFKILRGSGQGNPLSCLIFILSVNFLMIKLNLSPNLSRFSHKVQNIAEIIDRCFGYADDLCTLLNPCKQDIFELGRIFEMFEGLSGLSLNKKKTAICCINNSWDMFPQLRDTIVNAGYSLGGENITLLGHQINLNGESSVLNNWNNVIRSVNSTLFKARSLNLCTLGKVTVVKSFILGKIAYTGRSIPLPQDVEETLKVKIHAFLNEGGCRFSSESIFKSKESFGLGIPCVKSFCTSLLVKNLSRFLTNDEVWGKILKSKFYLNKPDRCLTNSNLSSSLHDGALAFVSMGIKYYNLFPKKAPLFFSPVVKSWCPFNEMSGPPLSLRAPGDSERASRMSISKLNSIISNREGIINFLGYDPGNAHILRLMGVSVVIKIKLREDLSEKNVCFIHFLSHAKSSRALRTCFDSTLTVKSSPIDDYLGRVIGRSFNSNYLFKVFSKQVLTLRTRNSFLLLQLNKLKSKAQRAHFADVTPNCVACGEQENTAHLIYNCLHFQDCILNTSRFFGFQKIEILAAMEGEGRAGIVETIIMGSCILAALISSSRNKKVSTAMIINLAKSTLCIFSKKFNQVKNLVKRYPNWL